MILGVFLAELTKESTPMALDQSVCTELLEAFKSTDGVDRSATPCATSSRS